MTNAEEDAESMKDLHVWMRPGDGHDPADPMTRSDPTPAMHACFMLMLHELLLRNMTNPGVNDLRGQESVHVEWASWTGMTFHNLPTIALGRDEDGDRTFLIKECRDFVGYAATHPVPAAWHPSHPDSRRGLGMRWQSLCEHAAHLAGTTAEYGVAAVSRTRHLPSLPEIPDLGFIERFLPGRLTTFLDECRSSFRSMPTGPMQGSGWTHWRGEGEG